MDIVQGVVGGVIETAKGVSEARDRKKDLKHVKEVRGDLTQVHKIDLQHQGHVREEGHIMEREKHKAFMKREAVEFEIKMKRDKREAVELEIKEMELEKLKLEVKIKKPELKENEDNKVKHRRLTIKLKDKKREMKQINLDITAGIPRQMVREDKMEQASVLSGPSGGLEGCEDNPNNRRNAPRLCHIARWLDFQGYGFDLNAEKFKPGQFIGKIDNNSPAEMAGLKEGDRIIEVNSVNIDNENLKQVVSRIKAVPNETKLLVVDHEADQYYKAKNIVVRGDQSNVISGSSGNSLPCSLKKASDLSGHSGGTEDSKGLPKMDFAAVSDKILRAQRESKAVLGAQMTKNSPQEHTSWERDCHEFQSGGSPTCGANDAKAESSSNKIKSNKTIETIENRTYTKDGKVYEDEIVTTVVETDEGTKTTENTTTRHLGEADSFDFSKVKKSLPTDQKSRGRSSSSSSDGDDGKKSKSKAQSGDTSSHSSISCESTDDSYESSDDEDFAEAAHREINAKRKIHCVDKLKRSQEMCKYAKEWAVKMAKDEQMSHPPDSIYGQNNFCISSNQNKFKVEAKTVIDRWYDESNDHKFGKEPEGKTLKTGHFTRMIWKDCKQIGVGKARSPSGLKIFIVVNFDPKGNWMGQFAKQVPPVGGFPKRRDSSSSSSSESSSDEEDFIEDCIKSHNDYRKKHGVQPFKESKRMNKHAKEWAATIANKDKMEEQANNEYGENIYCVWSSNPKHKIKGNEAVDSWYSEVKGFAFGKEPTDLKAGNFTQLVWEDSKKIGVGSARSKSGKIYVVANYSPRGNYVGEFALKVHNIK